MVCLPIKTANPQMQTALHYEDWRFFHFGAGRKEDLRPAFC
jgi:hypothetical protein